MRLPLFKILNPFMLKRFPRCHLLSHRVLHKVAPFVCENDVMELRVQHLSQLLHVGGLLVGAVFKRFWVPVLQPGVIGDNIGQIGTWLWAAILEID
jgi:hypothetical protein